MSEKGAARRSAQRLIRIVGIETVVSVHAVVQSAVIPVVRNYTAG